MTPEGFKDWRKSLGLKQKEAADKLGLKKRVIQYYEKGHRDGKSVAIPKNVELACVALALGYEGFDAALLPEPKDCREKNNNGNETIGGESALIVPE